MKHLCIAIVLLLAASGALGQEEHPVRSDDGTFVIDGEGGWQQVAEGVWEHDKPDGEVVHYTRGAAGRRWLLERLQGQTHELLENHLERSTPESESQLADHLAFIASLERSLDGSPLAEGDPTFSKSGSSFCCAVAACCNGSNRYCCISGSSVACSAVDSNCPTEGYAQCTNGSQTTTSTCQDCPKASLSPCTLEYPPRTYEVTGSATSGQAPYTPYWRWAGGAWFSRPSGSGPFTETFTNGGPFTVEFKVKDAAGKWSQVLSRYCSNF